MVVYAIRRIATAAESVQDCRYEVAAHAYLANVTGIYHGITPARPYSEEAVRRASAAGDDSASIVALCSRGLNRMQGGQLELAEADFQQALALIERCAAISYQNFAMNVYGVLLLEQGRFAEAREVLRAAIRLAHDSAAWQDLVVVTGNLLLVEHESGDRATAMVMAREVLGLSERAQLLPCTIGAWSILGLYALEAGDIETARDYRREIVAHAEGRDYWVSDASYAEIFLARLSVVEGDPETALARLDHAIAAYLDRDFFCRTRLQLEQARVTAYVDPTRARQLAEEVRDQGENARAWQLVARANRVLQEIGAAAR